MDHSITGKSLMQKLLELNIQNAILIVIKCQLNFIHMLLIMLVEKFMGRMHPICSFAVA